MTRRLPLALLALLVAGGCNTFTDEGVAARLGDRELTITELEDTLAEAAADQAALTGSSVPDRGATIAAADARQAINNWWFEAVTASPGLVTGYAGLVDRYAAGDGSLDVACLFVVQAADRPAAEALVARIGAGEAWADVAAEVDPGASDAGRQGCSPVSAFNPTIAAQLAALPVDGTPSVVDDPSGSGVAFAVRAATADEITETDLVPIAIVNDPAPLAEALWINPAYGQFDTDQLGVVALG